MIKGEQGGLKEDFQVKKITFILGGIRSGKTHFVYQIIDKKIKHSVTYIATGLPVDKEIRQRIKLHIESRPKNWQTIEEPLDLLKAINKTKTHVVIIDCINFWLSNLLKNKIIYKNILIKTENLMETIRKKSIKTIIISNEVGLMLVPKNKLARKFQELLGKINQIISRYSDTVYFLVAGNPIKIK